jgi:hypothetical protein
MTEWLEGPAIADEWYKLHTADVELGYESPSALKFDTLGDKKWVSAQLLRDGLEAILTVCNRAVGSETGIAKALGGGRRTGTHSYPRLTLGPVNPEVPVNDEGKVIDGTGVHWILVATVEDHGGDLRNEFAVEIDPMTPSPRENAKASDVSKDMILHVFKDGKDDESWALGWEKGMAAILGQKLPGEVPALQHREANDCGVWVLMMIWFIMAILRKKVDPETAVKAVHDLHGSVAHFRKFLREELLAAKNKADAYAKAHPESSRKRSADQGPDVVSMEQTKLGKYGKKN